MNNSNISYQEQLNIEHTIKLRAILATMPSFTKDYFRAIESTSSAKTRISYAYDIRIFFNYLLEANPLFKNHACTKFTIKNLDDITPVDIEEYYDYLKVYDNDGKLQTNNETGLARKISSLRSFFKYYHKHGFINNDPTTLIATPKIHEKSIVRLEIDEVARLLDYVENCGSTLTGQALNYYEKTKLRDLAILTLLLGTGIRVSECVGIDINDIDFNTNKFVVTRKGGNQSDLYFGTEVEEALKSYIYNDRKFVNTLSGHENALFLSTQKKRIGVQAIENMVKKYSCQVTPTKKITPHKLRSTYGTNLYKETGDIYLVADVLGHRDVNTTKKHYAAMDEERRRKAAKAVKLRKD